MPKQDDSFIMEGKVVDAAPGAKFKVELDTGHQINAVISGRIRKNNIRITLDDRVSVEMSPYDLNIGRIVRRL